MESRNKALLYVTIALVLTGATVAAVYVRPGTSSKAQSDSPIPPPSRVSGLGRIRPEGTTVLIGARSLSGQPSMVSDLRVKEGDYVKAGQVVAILDSLPELDAAARQAQENVKVAGARLKQLEAGAKPADIAAQEAELAGFQAQLSNATKTFTRTQNLFNEDIASQAALDHDRLAVDEIRQQIEEGKQRLRSLSEVRPVDIDVATAELHAAEAEVQRTKAEAEAAVIRAPYNGSVLKINAWRGAEVGSQGILELARVDHMYVVAEVAESDIQRVKVGQRATITGYSLGRPVEGAVEQLGMKVSRNSLAADNPVNITDARVFEVRIRLDDASKVQNLIDAQVDVLINP